MWIVTGDKDIVEELQGAGNNTALVEGFLAGLGVGVAALLSASTA